MMKEFFHGWRRKAGVFTLMIACGFLTLWFRAGAVEDVILTGNGKGTVVSLQLSRKGVAWNRYEGLVMKPAMKWWREPPVAGQEGPPRVFFTREPIAITRGAQWYIFSYGQIQNSLGNTMDYWVLSFWSITIPLTLLSAYLILWKPRNRVR